MNALERTEVFVFVFVCLCVCVCVCVFVNENDLVNAYESKLIDKCFDRRLLE